MPSVKAIAAGPSQGSSKAGVVLVEGPFLVGVMLLWRCHASGTSIAMACGQLRGPVMTSSSALSNNAESDGRCG